MCGGIKKCAEIVQNLYGTILAQFFGEASENMSAQILRIFRTRLELFLRPSCTGKLTLKPSPKKPPP